GVTSARPHARAAMKKAPQCGAPNIVIVARSGGRLYAGGLGPLRSLRDFVADPLAFLQGAEALGCNGRIVHEHVGAAGLGGDEAEPLGVVEPLHGAVLHSDADLVLDGMRAPGRSPGALPEYAKGPPRLAITRRAMRPAGARRRRWPRRHWPVRRPG